MVVSMVTKVAVADPYGSSVNASWQVLEDLELPRGGWEEKLLLQCRRNMVASPKRGEAILFYNQHPDGRKDLVSSYLDLRSALQGIRIPSRLPFVSLWADPWSSLVLSTCLSCLLLKPESFCMILG